MYRAAAVTLLLVVASSASAQVFFEPVQYQHTNGMTYYYGGNDPSMKDYIEHVKCRNGYPSAVTGEHYNSLRNTVGQIGEQTYVFSDCLGYRNAAVYGYTSVDARNEANNAVPRYFRKSDQLEAAVQQADGSFVVPASGKSHYMPKYDAAKHNGAATQPAATQPRAIIRITPRKAPKPQGDEAEVRKVMAAAN
jgi:hypothetical protein